MKTFTAEQIYNALSTQSFYEWYDIEFADHIEGAEEAPSKEEILEAIEAMFQ